MRRACLSIVTVLLFAGSARAVDAPAAAAPATQPSTRPAGFEKEIAAYEAADARQMPAPGGILFLGSSSIRLWKTLDKDFAGLAVLNRGFGGSTIPDSVRYAPRILLPYKPKTVVFYAGDNDINKNRSPEQVAADFKELVGIVHKDLPETRVLYIAIKPSPKRWAQYERQTEANRLIRTFAEADPKRLGYIDVVTPMLGPDGKPRDELYVADKLHMTPKGYEVWTSVVKPYLK